MSSPPAIAMPATEAVDPRYADLDAWPDDAVLDSLLEAQLAAVAAVRPALPALAAAAAAAAVALAAGGRLIYVGAGTSGRIAAQDGAELPPTFDWPRERIVLLLAGGAAASVAAREDAEDDAAAARAAVLALALGPTDVVLGLAASGGTVYTCAALACAAEAGAVTIGIANAAGARLLQLARFAVLLETGAEPIAGSTRLKAGTAQKVALNLLSTLVMVRLGRVHRGLMVDMRASNAKLRARALRMVSDLTGATPAAARTALDAADGRVKTAVLLVRGQDRAAADRLLARHGGRLRAALAEIDHDRD